jgi:hypothetical protein
VTAAVDIATGQVLGVFEGCNAANLAWWLVPAMAKLCQLT